MSKCLRPTSPSALSYLSRVKSGDPNHGVTTEKEHGDPSSGVAHMHPPMVGDVHSETKRPHQANATTLCPLSPSVLHGG